MTGSPSDPASTKTVGSPSRYEGKTRTSAADMYLRDLDVRPGAPVLQAPGAARVIATVPLLGAVAHEHAEEPVARSKDRIDQLAHSLGREEVAHEQDDDAVVDEV